MSQQDTIATIGTPMMPEPVSFSPEAPGWILLFVLVLLGIVAYFVVQLLKYRRNRYRREGVLALEQILARVDDQDRFYKAATMLKRVALTSYGRAVVATLCGNEWVTFLRGKIQEKMTISEASENILTNIIYSRKSHDLADKEVLEFKNELINWIKKHRV